MKTFIIEARDAGSRLSRYIEKVAPGMPKSGMYKALRSNRIKINRKKPADLTVKLQDGDSLQLFFTDDCFEAVKETRPDFMNASAELLILYEDENIAVLYKPVGVNSHPVKDDYSDNMVARFLRYLYKKGEYNPGDSVFTPALCNRLDRNTDGMIIAAKTREAASEVNKLIADGNLTKKYKTVCVSKNFKDGIYSAWHFKGDDNTVKISDTQLTGYKDIKTGFRTIKTSGLLSLLEVTLYTGRTHQIRAHLAHLGAPVLGDPKYGKRSINSKYGIFTQCLTAISVTFSCKEDSSLFYLNNRTISLDSHPFEELFSL